MSVPKYIGKRKVKKAERTRMAHAEMKGKSRCLYSGNGNGNGGNGNSQ